MGFIILLASIIFVRLTWRIMSRRYTTAKFDGHWQSESYKRRIAASASDYKTRREFSSLRGNI